MPVQVLLEDHTGNWSHEAKLSETARIELLLPHLITQLDLPIVDSAGRHITYHLSHRGRRLRENETLNAAQVLTGDIITVVPEMTAGAIAPGMLA